MQERASESNATSLLASKEAELMTTEGPECCYLKELELRTPVSLVLSHQRVG